MFNVGDYILPNAGFLAEYDKTTYYDEAGESISLL